MGTPAGPGAGVSSKDFAGTFLDFNYGLPVHGGGGETRDVRLKATF